MRRYRWPFVLLETLLALVVVAPVMSLALYIPTHNFTMDGWTFWPLEDWYHGEFEPIEILAFLVIVWFVSGISRSQRKELFDE